MRNIHFRKKITFRRFLHFNVSRMYRNSDDMKRLFCVITWLIYKYKITWRLSDGKIFKIRAGLGPGSESFIWNWIKIEHNWAAKFKAIWNNLNECFSLKLVNYIYVNKSKTRLNWLKIKFWSRKIIRQIVCYSIITTNYKSFTWSGPLWSLKKQSNQNKKQKYKQTHM